MWPSNYQRFLVVARIIREISQGLQKSRYERVGVCHKKQKRPSQFDERRAIKLFTILTHGADAGNRGIGNGQDRFAPMLVPLHRAGC